MSTAQRSKDARTIDFEGNLTVQNIEEVKRTLENSLAKAGDVTLRFGAVTDIDLTGLQLICSVHRTAARGKRRIQIETPVPKAVSDAAESAGFLRLNGCKQDPEKTCFWAAIKKAEEQRG